MRRAFPALILLIGLGHVHGARAVESVQEERAEVAESSAASVAIRHAYAGRERFEAGDYRGALAEFEQSKALAISPVVELFIARSQRALGHWLLARQSYRACLSVPPDPDNVAWTEAQKSGVEELAELEKMVPRVSVVAPRLAGTEEVYLRIDGVTYPWPAGRGVELDPGAHVLVATFSDQSYSVRIVLSPSEEAEVSLPFVPSRAAPPARKAETPPSPQPITRGDAKDSPRSLAPFIVGSFALAGAGVVFGTVAGILTLEKAGAVREFCGTAGNSCPNNLPEDPDMARMREEALGWSTASTVGFVAAGVSAATGGILLLIQSSSRSTSSLGLMVGGSSLFLEGRF